MVIICHFYQLTRTRSLIYTSIFYGHLIPACLQQGWYSIGKRWGTSGTAQTRSTPREWISNSPFVSLCLQHNSSLHFCFSPSRVCSIGNPSILNLWTLFAFFLSFSFVFSGPDTYFLPSLYPCPSCQGVYICPPHGWVPNKVEKIRGEKTALLPARVPLSLSCSHILTVDIFQLIYSWPLLLQWSSIKNFTHPKPTRWRKNTVHFF